VHFDIRSVFYLAVVPGLLAFALVVLVKEPRAAVAAKAKIDVSPRQFPVAYRKYLLAIALFGLGNSSNAFLILRTQDIGASLENTILIYAAFNLVAALISYPAGSLTDRWGGRNVLFAAFGIFLIGYLGFAMTQNVTVIAALFVFYGLYQGIFRTAGKALASSFVSDRLRASGIGWYNTTVGLLQLVASVAAGLLWDRVGHAAVFYYGAFFAAVGMVALIWLVPAHRESRHGAA
jgi:MFS family permease